MGINHYENFPVASWLLPRALRPAVLAIYRFARTADDLADEGDAAPQQRLHQLQQLSIVLDQIESGLYPLTGQNWSDLANVIRQHQLPIGCFRDLLSAFSQDASGSHFATDAQLFDYCRRSANPVGRLMLCLYQQNSPRQQALSDHICTGLQLVNFWQDVALDLAKGRVNLPDDILARYQVTHRQIAQGQLTPAFSALMQQRTQLARSHLLAGQSLCRQLGGRIGWELRLVVQGGLHIARRLDATQGNVFTQRPTVRVWHWPVLLLRAAFMP